MFNIGNKPRENNNKIEDLKLKRTHSEPIQPLGKDPNLIEKSFQWTHHSFSSENLLVHKDIKFFKKSENEKNNAFIKPIFYKVTTFFSSIFTAGSVKRPTQIESAVQSQTLITEEQLTVTSEKTLDLSPISAPLSIDLKQESSSLSGKVEVEEDAYVTSEGQIQSPTNHNSATEPQTFLVNGMYYAEHHKNDIRAEGGFKKIYQVKLDCFHNISSVFKNVNINKNLGLAKFKKVDELQLPSTQLTNNEINNTQLVIDTINNKLETARAESTESYNQAKEELAGICRHIEVVSIGREDQAERGFLLKLYNSGDLDKYIVHQFFNETEELLQEDITTALGVLKSVKNFHALGFIHKDIKPSNFIRHAKKDHEGKVHNKIYLTDYGLIQKNDPLIISRQDGDVFYRPPMQQVHDQSIDVYATGITLYNLFCHQTRNEWAEFLLEDKIIDEWNSPEVVNRKLDIENWPGFAELEKSPVAAKQEIAQLIRDMTKLKDRITAKEAYERLLAIEEKLNK
ncbi:MAG: serine/threonine protein kinase [Chlamydiales bacterium]|jgi:hypothetical protein|nr:serine/threonine protein kinase [Chlamydiales bacterium]